MSDPEKDARYAVLEIAIKCLGRMALEGPGGEMSAQHRLELRQSLFDCLEVLNDEKENYDGS